MEVQKNHAHRMGVLSQVAAFLHSSHSWNHGHGREQAGKSHWTSEKLTLAFKGKNLLENCLGIVFLNWLQSGIKNTASIFCSYNWKLDFFPFYHILEETKIWMYGCTPGKYSKVLCLVSMRMSFEVSKALAIRNNGAISIHVHTFVV